ncbi:MAG: hypothetical protein HQ483_15585 [Rhodospirillales bacterium]|nr:hypothetical protein [Rhodospirillales bacterium]
MKNLVKCMMFGVVAVSLASFGTRAYAADIENAKQCAEVVADTVQAVEENPSLGDKSEKILLEVMNLAQQRCDEKNFSAAQELLELARGMVASE